MYANRRNFRVLKKIGVEEHEGDVRFSPEVEIRPFRACSVHSDIIIGTVRSLWTWQWGRYHVPQNAFLVVNKLSSRRLVHQHVPRHLAVKLAQHCQFNEHLVA